jgi:hypothetical protein
MIARSLPDAVDERELDRAAVIARAREGDGVETGAGDEAGDLQVQLALRPVDGS